MGKKLIALFTIVWAGFSFRAAADMKVEASVEKDKTGYFSKRFEFSGGTAPYTIVLEQHMRKTKNGYEPLLRGIGLRYPWYKGAGSNAWHISSFLDIQADGHYLVNNSSRETFPLYESAEILETGKKALIDLRMERREASLRLRFMMTEKCPSVIFCQITVEPKIDIKELVIGATAYPGAYTSKNNGNREARTAIRTIPCMKNDPAVKPVPLDIGKENWALLYDATLDLGNPQNRLIGANGCAGIYVKPGCVEEFQVKPTTYPVTVHLKKKTQPGKPIVITMAFEDMQIPVVDAYNKMSGNWEAVGEVFGSNDFVPTVISSFSKERELAKINELAKSSRIPQEPIEELKKSLADVLRLKNMIQEGNKPVSSEALLLEGMDVYKRKYMTLKRKSL